MKTTLKVSESFVSIQGEGKTAGKPAVFLRLSGCPLECFFCDTLEKNNSGEVITPEQLVEHWEIKRGDMALEQGAHLVITGGDPLLQQRKLPEFLDRVMALMPRVKQWYLECETEGIIKPTEQFANYISQWNVSPKLANSGMAKKRRIKPEVLKWHIKNSSSIFKFAVSTCEDVSEAMEVMHELGMNDKSRVWLMPVAKNWEDLMEASKHVVEWAMYQGFHFSSRHQIMIWNTTCGV